MDYDAVVIGAGLGGLSSAAMLAKNGYKTLILENTGQVGGCCSSYDHEGYRFDIGASVVELDWVIDDLFKKLGRKTEDFIDFIPIDPIYGFFTADGRRFSYPVSVEGTREVIAQFSEEDARAWDRFSEVGSEAINFAFGKVMSESMGTMKDLIKVAIANPALAKYMKYMVLNFESVLCKFFKSDTVRASMSLQSYFVGLPPALCPGYVAFLAYSEHEGIYYPRGGMSALPEGIQRAGEESGLEVRLNQKVEKILLDGKRACGIRLEDGTEVTSKIVVSNVNAKVTYLKMIGPENLAAWAKKAIGSYEMAMASPMVYVGLDTRPPLHAHNTMGITSLEAGNRIWHDHYKRGLIPTQCGFLLNWPTESDPSLAPQGHHILNLAWGAPAPYAPLGDNWDRLKPAFTEAAIGVLEREVMPDIRDHLQVVEAATPLDFERMLLLPRGAIYGLFLDLFSAAMFRPHPRSRVVKNLYLAGASTGMGGSLPTTLASGVVASDYILQDHG